MAADPCKRPGSCVLATPTPYFLPPKPFNKDEKDETVIYEFTPLLYKYIHVRWQIMLVSLVLVPVSIALISIATAWADHMLTRHRRNRQRFLSLKSHHHNTGDFASSFQLFANSDSFVGMLSSIKHRSRVSVKSSREKLDPDDGAGTSNEDVFTDKINYTNDESDHVIDYASDNDDHSVFKSASPSSHTYQSLGSPPSTRAQNRNVKSGSSLSSQSGSLRFRD